jgi:hypothetical protein
MTARRLALLLVAPLALAGCGAPVLPAPEEAALPVVQVSHQAYAPAPQPLPEEVLAALPADVATSDVFIAPDGCWFFLQGSDLMLLTVLNARGTEQVPYCP